MCNHCGYSPHHCTCGFGPRAIQESFRQTVKERAYVVARSHPVSTTKKVYVPAGMVVDPRRGNGWRLS